MRRALFVFLLLVCFWAAGDSRAAEMFVWGDTAPDSGTAVAPEVYTLADAISGYGNSIGLGDYIETTGTESLATLNARYAALLAVLRPTYATPGNHEITYTANGKAAYIANLGTFQPFAVQWPRKKRRVLIVHLPTEGQNHSGRLLYYGEDDSRNSTEAKWLVETLRANTLPLIVVYMHHPIYDSKTTDPWATTYKSEPPRLDALFAKYGVDLVLAGHVHYYRRHVSASGVTYLTIGPNGSDPRAETFVPLDGRDIAHWGSPYRGGFVRINVDLLGVATCGAYRWTGTTWQLGDVFEVAP